MFLAIIKDNLSKEINKIAIDICFMLSNMIANDTVTTKSVLIEGAVINNLLIIDGFFPNFEVTISLYL